MRTAARGVRLAMTAALLAGCSSPAGDDTDARVMELVAEGPAAAGEAPGGPCPILPEDLDVADLVDRHVGGARGALQGPVRHASHASDGRSGILQCVFLQELAETTTADGGGPLGVLVVAAHANMDELTMAADGDGPVTVLGQDRDGNLTQLLHQPVPAAGGLLYQEAVGDRSVITVFVDGRLDSDALGPDLLAAAQRAVERGRP